MKWPTKSSELCESAVNRPSRTASLHILLPSNSEVQPEYPHPLRYLVGNFFGQDFLFGITGGKPLKKMLFPYIRSKNFANGAILNLYRCLSDVGMGLRIRKLRK